MNPGPNKAGNAAAASLLLTSVPWTIWIIMKVENLGNKPGIDWGVENGEEDGDHVLLMGLKLITAKWGNTGNDAAHANDDDQNAQIVQLFLRI